MTKIGKQELIWHIERDFADSEQLCTVVEQSGNDVVRFTYHELASNFTKYPRIKADYRLGIYYGCINTMKLVRSTTFIPGIWLDKQLEYLNYAPIIGDHLLNDNYRVLPLKELARQVDMVYWDIGGSGDGTQMFVRPNSALKPFDGQVVRYLDFKAWYNELMKQDVDTNTLCIFSSVKDIIEEERFVVAEGKVVAGSSYKPNIDWALDETWWWLEEVLSKIELKLYPVFVIDVATLKSGRKAIIECNSINCAGLYQCHIPDIVKNINRLAVQEYEENS